MTPALASAMPAALAAVRGDHVHGASEVEDSEVGDLILRALTVAADPPLLELRWVTIQTATETLRLDPASACDHPLLQGWVEMTAADALSRPLVAGARRHDLSPIAPAIDSVSILTCLGGATAVAYSRFATHEGQAQVIARYGVDVPPPALTTTVAVTGAALNRVGRAARAAAELNIVPEPREELGPIAAELQPAGTMH